MDFGTVIQAVEANQEKSENEFTMEDLLGLVVLEILKFFGKFNQLFVICRHIFA